MNTTFLTNKQYKLFKKVQEFHKGQFRKYTNNQIPYHEHPLEVARIISECNSKMLENSRAIEIALLHDVLEDCPKVSKEHIYEALMDCGYTVSDRRTILEGVSDLTDEFTSEKYPNTNRSLRKQKECLRLSRTGKISQSVKCADIAHNMSEPTGGMPLDFRAIYVQEAVMKLDSLREADICIYIKACAAVMEFKQNMEFLISLEKVS